MIGPDPVAAVVTYLVPLALAGLLLASARHRSPWLVGGVLAALPVFYAVQFTLVQNLAGWPSEAPLPDEFELLAYVVEEPDRARDSAGEILLWLRASEAADPRVHRLEYDRALHQSLDEAGERIAEGRRQVGRTQRPDPQSERRDGDATGPGVSFGDMKRRGLPPKPTLPNA